MLELNQIYNMDCLKGLMLIEDNCIDLTVTSPPYDNLRTYNGYSFDFEGIAKELYRVTKDGGVVVWVVADATINGSETGTSFRQALYFKDIGFNLHDTMIYKTDKPPMNDNRYQACFEYMFVLSKGKPNIFRPIKEKTKHAGEKNTHAKYYNADGSMKERHGKKPILDEKIKESIWYIPNGTDKDGVKHPAVFPIKLAKDHIKSWSNENDTVLDPFMGSGTTAKAAYDLRRSYIGFEISKEYCDIANERLNNHKAQLRFDLEV